MDHCIGLTKLKLLLKSLKSTWVEKAKYDVYPMNGKEVGANDELDIVVS